MSKKIYILHSVGWENIENVLKTGILYANKYIPEERRRFAGGEELPYVYTNIYFRDIKNISLGMGITLIFDSKIIYSQGLIFNDGWMVHPTNDSIYLNPEDGKAEINKKLKLIKNRIIHRMKTSKSIDIMHHEALFIGRIILENNLTGILCPECTDEQLSNIKNILDKLKLKIKIYNKLTELK